MNHALLYVRVSSKEQEREGFSLDAQEKLGHDYAHRKGLTITKTWKVSESAWREERKAFNQLVEYAKRHTEIGHIIFDVTDRMTRNDFDKLKIYTLIREHGKTIHFSRSNKIFNRESGSDDEFMFDIEVAVAKKTSNDISRKAKMGMLEKAEQGLYPSTAPIGYKNNLVTRTIEVDEERAAYIKKAFSLKASGSHSLDMIANSLYEEGFRGKKGHRIGKSMIAHILNNPIYYGAFLWKGKMYQGSHTPLITKELFDKVQDGSNGKSRPSVRKNGFSFNNLLTCGLCGCKILGEQKKGKYNYYHCTFSKGRHNGIGYVPEERLATLFEEPVRRITLNEDIVDWLKDALRETNKDSLKLRENRLRTLQSQRERVSTRLSRLLDAKFDGEISEEVFRSKENEYNTELIEIKARVDSEERTNPNFYDNGSKILELSNRLLPLYLRANYEEKAKILKLVASNYILSDVTLVPVYRKPFDLIAEGLACSNWLPRQDSNLGQAR